MFVSNPVKTISKEALGCGETATVTLGFQAAAGLAQNSADVVLLLDRSDAVPAEAWPRIQTAAGEFADGMASASGSTGAITNGSRMGIISFSDTAAQDSGFTGDVTALRNALSSVTPGGGQNYAAGFEAAENLLTQKTAARGIILLFTADGQNTGEDPQPVIDRLKAAGTEVYCIGLGSDRTSPELWASEPKKDHVAMAADADQLQDAFTEILGEVVLAGGLDVELREQLAPDFEIVSLGNLSDGVGKIPDPHTLLWNIDAAGFTEQPAPVTLTFDIKHIGTTPGAKAFNASLTYQDRAQNVLDFPSPAVTVTPCAVSEGIYPEPCPEPTSFTVEGCKDFAAVALNPAKLLSQGRVVQVDVTIQAVCPGKRLSVTVFLTETDAAGLEYNRGVRHILVPAQEGEGCRDITLKCLQFSVAEALDPQGDPSSICGPRHFRARVLANYVDTDFICCEDQTVTP